MHDPTPEASLKILGDLCGSIDVYAASVVLPGVNDGEHLVSMCEWLEERGARGIILMRFANSRENGLILGNPPIIAGQRVHTPDEFRDIVTDLSKRFKSLKVSGTPLWDPEIGSPFAILAEPDLIAKLPRVTGRASVITGSVAAPYIRKILSSCGTGADVVPVAKDIACLITIDDLEALDPATLEKTVIIPGRAFVHDREAERVLSADGVERTVVRDRNAHCRCRNQHGYEPERGPGDRVERFCRSRQADQPSRKGRNQSPFRSWSHRKSDPAQIPHFFPIGSDG